MSRVHILAMVTRVKPEAWGARQWRYDLDQPDGYRDKWLLRMAENLDVEVGDWLEVTCRSNGSVLFPSLDQVSVYRGDETRGLVAFTRWIKD